MQKNLFSKLLASLLLFGWSSFVVLGQPGFAVLDTNNIRMGVNSDGSAYSLNGQGPQFETPKDSGTATIYASNLWLGAMGDNGVLRMAAHTYKQFGTDFWAGPVNPSSGAAANPGSWNKVWKVNKSVVEYHIANYTNTNYVIPPEIANWPGNGSAGFSPKMAPFVDLNNNQIYEPWLGDYPYVKGDQALYFIFNDKFGFHGETTGAPLGVEVHGMAFSYDHPVYEEVRNTVFVRYRVVNRNPAGTDTLNDLYMGIWTDFDIGSYADDYVGADSARSMYYAYNGDPFDSTGGPGSATFGVNPPAQAVVFLNRPMTNALYYVNDLVPNGNPSAPHEYYNYMKSMWRDSTHLTYWGDGYMDSSTPVNYSFPGNPVLGAGWTEGNAGNPPADRRMLGSTGPYSIAPGEYLTFDIAYVYERSTEGNIGSLASLYNAVDFVRTFYSNYVGIEEPKSPAGKILAIYPNPSAGIATIRFDNPRNERFIMSLYDITGKMIREPEQITGTTASIDCARMTAGMYFVVLSSPQATYTGKLAVEK
jgi:hypothetical protein